MMRESWRSDLFSDDLFSDTLAMWHNTIISRYLNHFVP